MSLCVNCSLFHVLCYRLIALAWGLPVVWKRGNRPNGEAGMSYAWAPYRTAAFGAFTCSLNGSRSVFRPQTTRLAKLLGFPAGTQRMCCWGSLQSAWSTVTPIYWWVSVPTGVLLLFHWITFAIRNCGVSVGGLPLGLVMPALHRMRLRSHECPSLGSDLSSSSACSSECGEASGAAGACELSARRCYGQWDNKCCIT